MQQLSFNHSTISTKDYRFREQKESNRPGKMNSLLIACYLNRFIFSSLNYQQDKNKLYPEKSFYRPLNQKWSQAPGSIIGGKFHLSVLLKLVAVIFHIKVKL